MPPTTVQTKSPAACGERERAGDDRSDGELEEDERGAVVDEALALDDRDRATRHAEPARDRRRGDRVGRRDDRAEHECRRPTRGRSRSGSDRDRRPSSRSTSPIASSEIGSDVPPQLAQAGVEGGRVEERRQDADEHDVRRQRDVRHARREAEHEAADDEQDRIRDAQRVGEQEQPQSRDRSRAGAEALRVRRTSATAGSRVVPHVRDLRNRVHPRHRRPRRLAAMSATLVQRGPDSDGAYVDGRGRPRCAGASRSSTSTTGDQPISNEDGSVVVVQNGEIYNYRELRPSSSAPGTAFSHARRHRGARARCTRSGAQRSPNGCAGCSRSRSGTRERGRLVLARDRYGIKPLYYRDDGRRDRVRLRAAGAAARRDRPRRARGVPRVQLRSRRR